MAEEKRHEMMETLFGAESGDSDEEPEAAPVSGVYSDEEAEPVPESEGERESEVESEGEQGYSDDAGEVDQRQYIGQAASGEASDDVGEEASFDGGAGEGEGSDEGGVEGGAERGREASYGEGEDSDEGREYSVEKRHIGKEAEHDTAEREYGAAERGEASEEGEEASVSSSGHYEPAQEREDDNDEEVNASREPSCRGNDQQGVDGAVEIRDVFGDSEEDEMEGHVRHQPSPRPMSDKAPSDDEATDQKGVRPQDVVMDEEEQYDSEEEQQFERKPKEKPVGPPLNLVIPLQPPPARSEKMNLVRISNIMDIEPKQFDSKTYVEEETFVTDEAGQKQRLRLEENVVRWRVVQNPDESLSYESNARFVKWSDGSMQLLIGNEVLDLSVQDARQDQSHIFVRHPKGMLQSQGRLLQKMRFMPSSLASKSHRLLTALVEKQHKKVYKVKNIITTFDPEKDKEEKEKALEQQIRSREDLQRKQEKINRKYLPAREREPQLSPGYLEGALEEEEERDEYYEGKKALDARRFQEQLEAEGRAERRIINAKQQTRSLKDTAPKRMKERLPPPRSKREVEESFSEESEREPSEFGSDQQEAEVEFHDEAEEEEEEQEMEDEADEEVEEEVEEDEEAPRNWKSEERNKSHQIEEEQYGERDDESSRKRKARDREDDYSPQASPPKKTAQRRRVVVSDSEEED